MSQLTPSLSPTSCQPLWPQPLHVAAWIERQTHEHSARTAQQRLTAQRRPFDWLITGGVLPTNPAAAVHGPRHSA
jgi:site-specific recombinase XerC